MPFLPDEVEALVAIGNLEEAKALLLPFERRARRLERVWALAVTARCRALIASAEGEVAGALRHLSRSLAEHDRLGQPFELARTLLVAGQIHRRMKEKRASKQALQRAVVIFEQLGSPLWADKARAELARVGLRPSAPLGLTPTEEQVARLVAGGKTNREVAAELFVSVRTVEDNLSRIYRKLGVRSRAGLARSFVSGNGSR